MDLGAYSNQGVWDYRVRETGEILLAIRGFCGHSEWDSQGHAQFTLHTVSREKTTPINCRKTLITFRVPATGLRAQGSGFISWPWCIEGDLEV